MYEDYYGSYSGILGMIVQENATLIDNIFHKVFILAQSYTTPFIPLRNKLINLSIVC